MLIVVKSVTQLSTTLKSLTTNLALLIAWLIGFVWVQMVTWHNGGSLGTMEVLVQKYATSLFTEFYR